MLEGKGTMNAAMRHCTIASECYSRGDIDGAITEYNKALKLKPDLLMAWHFRGRARYEKGEYDEAIADCTEAIRLSPDYLPPWKIRADAWSDKGEHGKAITDYSAAIRRRPHFAQAWNSRGCSWSDRGEYEKAIADFTEVIRLNPDFAEAWSNRGHAWHRKGEYERALSDCHEAVRLKPEAAINWLHRGDAWLGSGEFDRAIADYAEALRLDPTLQEARTLLAVARKNRQDRIASLVERFHARFQDPVAILAHDRKEGGRQRPDGGIHNAHEEFAREFAGESNEVVVAAVQEIEADGLAERAAVNPPENDEKNAPDERLPADTVPESIRLELNSLVTGTPRIQIGPGFGLGDDGILHLTPPHDLRTAPADSELFEELKATARDLKSELSGTNVHFVLLEAVEQYCNALLGEKVSAQFLFAKGVNLEKASGTTKRGIAARELPSLPIPIEHGLESALELHRTYIMTTEEGRDLVEAAAAYRLSRHRTDQLKAAGKQVVLSVADQPEIFGEDVLDYVSDAVGNMGEGPDPEKSNLIAVSVVGSLFTALCRIVGIASGGVAAVACIGSVPGDIAVALGTEKTNAFWSYLTQNVSALKEILSKAAS